MYIKEGFYVNDRTKRVLSGALSHRISRAGAHRVLHVMVAPESGDRPLITMAHELQHAIEVLEAPDVATEAAVDQLFEHIGMHVGTGIVETQAALNVECAVARELSAKRESGARGGLQSARFVVPMTGAEPTRLTVRLSIDQDGGLSALQLGLALDEVREIWSDVGVSVAPGRYGELSRPDEATISMRILLSPPPHRDGAERVLAWVTAIETGRAAPLLLVSLPAVTEAVMGADAWGRPVTKHTRGLRDRLIAQAIGRVTAHELGHYLLQNAGHQDRGLMRANYSSSDLVGSWLEPFRVPTAERPVVRQEIAALARLQAPFGDGEPPSFYTGVCSWRGNASGRLHHAAEPSAEYRVGSSTPPRRTPWCDMRIDADFILVDRNLARSTERRTHETRR